MAGDNFIVKHFLSFYHLMPSKHTEGKTGEAGGLAGAGIATLQKLGGW
jgi:hypothetical protein